MTTKYVADTPMPTATDDMDDDTLMAAIAGGNQEAGAVFIRRHLSYVLKLCQSRLQNAAEAEEAAQDVFLSVWKNAAHWQGGQAKMTTWLYRVAANRCIDILRRRRPTLELDEAPDIADDTDIEAASQQAAQSRLIKAALATLTPDQQRAIELVYYGELNQREAAEMMGIKLAAMESVLRRARQRLHDYLAEYHVSLALV